MPPRNYDDWKTGVHTDHCDEEPLRCTICGEYTVGNQTLCEKHKNPPAPRHSGDPSPSPVMSGAGGPIIETLAQRVARRREMSWRRWRLLNAAAHVPRVRYLSPIGVRVDAIARARAAFAMAVGWDRKHHEIQSGYWV